MPRRLDALRHASSASSAGMALVEFGFISCFRVVRLKLPVQHVCCCAEQELQGLRTLSLE